MDEGIGREGRKQMSENMFVCVLGSCSNYCFEEGGSFGEHLLWGERRFGLCRRHNDEKEGDDNQMKNRSTCEQLLAQIAF
jgi:hypothetical protein